MNSEVIGRHTLLVQSNDRQDAEQHVLRFFATNQLVRYNSVDIDSHGVVNAEDKAFFSTIEAGLRANNRALENLLRELQAEGGANLQAWPSLQQGYVTKLLHTIVHFLDGFFGVDSALYNLVENSHQVTAVLQKRMQDNPRNYWIVPVIGTAADMNPDRVQALRPFGREK